MVETLLLLYTCTPVIAGDCIVLDFMVLAVAQSINTPCFPEALMVLLESLFTVHCFCRRKRIFTYFSDCASVNVNVDISGRNIVVCD